MKKISGLLALVVLFTVSSLAAPVKVVFIGNSFTAVEDVPGTVRSLALAAGFDIEVYTHAPGGVSVGDISQGTMAHMNNPQVFDLIRNVQPDYVVLQDNQGRFVNKNSFPNPAASKVVEGHKKIRDSMRHHNSCARMVFFAGWGLKQGWPDVGDGKVAINNIYENYITLNDSLKELVSPIGIAWLRSMATQPGVDLWSPDEAHQSASGGYLAAATIFTTIFHINTEQVNFSGNMNPATAQTMRRIAYQTVTDSAANTEFIAAPPRLSYANGLISAPSGYKNYSWYRNGILSNATGNILAPKDTGCYHVVINEGSKCALLSDTVCISKPTEVRDRELPMLRLSPNPAGNVLYVTMANNARTGKFTITTIQGTTLLSGSINEASNTIDISMLPAGMYVINVSGNGNVSTARFVIQH